MKSVFGVRKLGRIVSVRCFETRGVVVVWTGIPSTSAIVIIILLVISWVVGISVIIIISVVVAGFTLLRRIVPVIKIIWPIRIIIVSPTSGGIKISRFRGICGSEVVE